MYVEGGVAVCLLVGLAWGAAVGVALGVTVRCDCGCGSWHESGCGHGL